MNRLLLFLLTLSTGVSAQIPNSSFEWWIDFGSHQEPSGWHCNNGSSGLELLQETSTQTKGTAVRIQNVEDENGIVERAMLQSGTRANPYFPVTGRPDALEGRIMFNAPGGRDACYIYIQLTHFNASLQQRELIGEGLFNTSETSDEYKMFCAPIIYYSSLNPDSAAITIYSGRFKEPQAGSCLYVDDLSFIELVSGITNKSSVDEFKVYPNPSSSYMKVEVPHEFINSKLLILDLIGNVAKSIALNDVVFFADVSDLKEGRYFYKIIGADKEVALTGSFVIDR